MARAAGIHGALADAGTPFRDAGSGTLWRGDGDVSVRLLRGDALDALAAHLRLAETEWQAGRWLEDAAGYGETVLAVSRGDGEPLGFAVADFRCGPRPGGGKPCLSVSVDLKAVYVMPAERSSGLAGTLRDAIADGVARAHGRLAALLADTPGGPRAVVCVEAECLSSGGAAFAEGLFRACALRIADPGHRHPPAGRTEVLDFVDYGEWPEHARTDRGTGTAPSP